MASMMYRSAVKTKLISQIVRRDRNSANLFSIRELSFYNASFCGDSKLKSSCRNPILYNCSSRRNSGASVPAPEAESEFIKHFKKNMTPKIMCHTQYHSMIDYYVEKGDVDSIENILAEMNQSGLPPTIKTINKLLSAYAKMGDGAGAQALVEEIKTAGIALDTETLGFLMAAYAKQGDYGAADKVLHDSMDNGIILGINFHSV